MAVRMTHGQFLDRAAKTQYRRLLKAAAVLQRDWKRRLAASNRKGEEPSLPGESPRRSQFGWLQANVKIAGNDKDRVRVGIGRAAWYGVVLENGTGPYDIRARAGRKLMIPIRRKLSEQEAKQIGAKRIVDPRDGQKKWVIFRDRVKHPGIKPRPWLEPGYRAMLPTLIRIIKGGKA